MRSVKSRVSPTGGNEKTERLARILSEEEQPDFELPHYITWPAGHKGLSDRATMLMLAGLKALEEAHPKHAKQEKEPAAKREIKGATRVKTNDLDGWG